MFFQHTVVVQVHALVPSITFSEAVTSPTDVNMSLRIYPVPDTEVSAIIDPLPDKSSSGEDEISNIVVKTTKSVVTKYLTSLMNQSFREVFPTELKKKQKSVQCEKRDQD